MGLNTVDTAVKETIQESWVSELDLVDMVTEKYGRKHWALISILQDIQERVGYLPPDILKQVADRMELPLTQIYGVATFYKSLSLTPQGRHTAWEPHVTLEAQIRHSLKLASSLRSNLVRLLRMVSLL